MGSSAKVLETQQNPPERQTSMPRTHKARGINLVVHSKGIWATVTCLGVSFPAKGRGELHIPPFHFADVVSSCIDLCGQIKNVDTIVCHYWKKHQEKTLGLALLCTDFLTTVDSTPRSPQTPGHLCPLPLLWSVVIYQTQQFPSRTNL